MIPVKDVTRTDSRINSRTLLTLYVNREVARDIAAVVAASGRAGDSVAPPSEHRSVCRVSRRESQSVVERFAELRLAPPSVGGPTRRPYSHVGRTVGHRRSLMVYKGRFHTVLISMSMHTNVQKGTRCVFNIRVTAPSCM